MTNPDKPSREPTLHVFTDRTDFYVGASIEDVRAAWYELTGEDLEWFASEEWEQLPDGHSMTIWCEDGFPTEPESDGAERVTKTHAEWAASNGRGFLASTEY